RNFAGEGTMKSDWLLPAIHFGYGRKGPEEAAHAYRRSLLFFYRIEASRRCPLCPRKQTCAVCSTRCPLWANSGHFAAHPPCPYPRKRRQSEAQAGDGVVMSP